MELLTNIIFVSIIITVINIIIINTIFCEYDLELKDKIKSGIYVFISSLSIILLYKNSSLDAQLNEAKKSEAVDSVFTELKCNDNLKQMSVPITLKNQNELELLPIPKIIPIQIK
jgi:hypothetical protein